MEVGDRWLGVAGVTHPSNHLAGRHSGPDFDVGPDSIAPSVIGAGGVVVEVEIDREPAVVVAYLEPAALGAPPVDFSHHPVGHGNKRCEPGSDNIHTEVSTRPTIASLTEDRSDLAAQDRKQHPVKEATPARRRRGRLDGWGWFGRSQHGAVGRSRSGWWRLRAGEGREVSDRGWAAGRLGGLGRDRRHDQDGDTEEDQTPPNAGRQHDSEVTAGFALYLRGTSGT
jgi:hypothetical protein